MKVELVYATADEARWQQIEVPLGTTVGEALSTSSLAAEQPAAVAVYGEVVTPDRVLEDGDRIELLRELLTDPMLARRARADAQKNR